METEKLVQKKLERFISHIEREKENYGSDREMGSSTIERHVNLLNSLEKELKETSKKLNQKELSSLLDAANAIYPLNFFTGTGYGTCYGVRQVLQIVKNVNSQYENLGSEEVRIAYTNALTEFYKLKYNYPLIPLGSFLESETDEGFPHHTIPWLNKELIKIETPVEKIELINNEVADAKKSHGR